MNLSPIALRNVQGTIDSCPACGGVDQAIVFVARGVPVDVGSVLPNEADARAAPLGDIALAYCYGCGLVWNRLFDIRHVAFRPGYEAGLHHSALFNSFVDELVDRLIRKYNLRNKDILEIGCGSGYLLRLLCERGANRGTGIDPTVPLEGKERVGAGHVEFIRDFYSGGYAGLPCDFLCCQSVLEDIRRPLEFLSDVRHVLCRPAAGAYFEVFNADRAFEEQNAWSIHYEQCNYFGLETFQSLFRRCGFHVLEAGICPGNDQYIFLEAKVASQAPAATDHLATIHELPAVLATFAAVHRSRVTQWREKLRSFHAVGGKVVLWGTGGKGISFLNEMQGHGGIRFAVDINPRRQGRFVPVSGQQIVPPAFLAQWRPDAVIITNAAYEREIRQQIAILGLQPELWNAGAASPDEWQLPA